MSNKRFWWIALIFFALSPIAWLQKEVVLVEYSQGRFYLQDGFTLGWIHSVEKEPWFEVYVPQNGKLLLQETYFKTFGAGTPSEGQFIETNDGFLHYAVNQLVEEVNMMVSDNVAVTLYTQQQEIKLYEFIENYSNVSIKIEDVFLWQYLRGEYYGEKFGGYRSASAK